MTRWLVPLVTLLVGLTLGLGASALASSRESARIPRDCLREPTGACWTIANWCIFLKHTSTGQIDDFTVRGLLDHWRLSCPRRFR